MLVLTRKKNESIMIGKEIEIMVLEITPTQIRLGVEAPKNYPVFRKEIFLEIQEENIKAAQQSVFTDDIGAELQELFQESE
ncbi:MAG: carbon storage regulator CsrA [Clostridia bacterium]|nr:carbon storage regulator CsrA [Clostridia bacterium]